MISLAFVGFALAAVPTTSTSSPNLSQLTETSSAGSIALTVTTSVSVPSATQRSLAPPGYKDYRTRWTYDPIGWVDYASTAALGVGWYLVEYRTKPRSAPRWTGGILFDDAARDLFVGGSAKVRNDAAAVSDVFALLPQGMLWLDIGIVLLTDRLNIETAWYMTVINLQSAALVGMFSRLGHRYVGRERPDVPPCRQDSEYNETCFGAPTAGFPSGHASASFMGAGLVCAHHLNLPIYGGGAPDYLACGAAVAMATTNAVSRLIADRHYLSDVIVGVGLGLAGGFMLPMLAHYRPPLSENARLAVVPVASGNLGGLAVVGVW